MAGGCGQQSLGRWRSAPRPPAAVCRSELPRSVPKAFPVTSLPSSGQGALPEFSSLFSHGKGVPQPPFGAFPLVFLGFHGSLRGFP